MEPLACKQTWEDINLLLVALPRYETRVHGLQQSNRCPPSTQADEVGMPSEDWHPIFVPYIHHLTLSG